VREIEQRIQRSRETDHDFDHGAGRARGKPAVFSEHMMLMFDLLAVA
jgi:hypothetical protein